MKIYKPIAITSGDPSSIAPLILIKSWVKLKNENVCFFTINNANHLLKVADFFKIKIKIKIIKTINESISVFKDALPVIDIPLPMNTEIGCPNIDNIPFIIKSLELGIYYAKNTSIRSIVTLPIEKNLMKKGGFNFIGHTEFLGYKSNIIKPIMMMASPFHKLKVIPIKTHLSLQNSIKTLSITDIIDTILITQNSFTNLFNIVNPKFIALGLNPHAGENGLMGKEEIQIITPAINYLKKQGIYVDGPIPADTAFSERIINNYDVIIGMYHDQVLSPFKALLFNTGVNITLGLPFIRTSPDHGTAFDIAKTNKANESSTVAAILLANNLQNNNEY